MKIRLREMQPEDVPVVLQRLKEQNERDGTKYAMQPVFDADGHRRPNIPLALVAVDETDNVLQGHVWERTLEHTIFGTDARASACAMHEQAAIAWMLRQKGYRDQHLFVMMPHVKALGHELDTVVGMKRTDGVMVHFYRLLDPAENEELRTWYEDWERGDNGKS